MEESKSKLILTDSPDGGFLQSEEWRRFQEAYGRKTFHLEGDGFWANVIEHSLPFVGKYLYLPRGPIFKETSSKQQAVSCIDEMVKLAKKNNAGWIRIEPADEKILQMMRESAEYEIVKAPHAMQPEEIFILDISKAEERLLSEMKSKTRYNIRLAEKKGVLVSSEQQAASSKNFDEFLRLVKLTAQRQEIVSHPEGYYRKMWSVVPDKNLKLYVAQHEGRIIAANLLAFYGDTVTYLHGASDNRYRESMAPFLLHWKAIQEAKAAGYEKYDFGGMDSSGKKPHWSGITRFKVGFSTVVQPLVFPGTFDLIVSPWRYRLYLFLQAVRRAV